MRRLLRPDWIGAAQTDKEMEAKAGRTIVLSFNHCWLILKPPYLPPTAP
jgi:hypothetical protein